MNGAIDYKCTGSESKGRHYDWPGCQSTCLCEDHCFWDRCYLKIPPKTCLSGTRSSWLWNAEDGFWIAQIQGKVCKLISGFVLPLKRIIEGYKSDKYFDSLLFAVIFR